jgi:hypothetical protein
MTKISLFFILAFMVCFAVFLVINHTNDIGNGILLEQSKENQLTEIEAADAQMLFDGDYYYRVLMIDGEYAGDTVNAVLVINSQKSAGDTVHIVGDGVNNTFQVD